MLSLVKHQKNRSNFNIAAGDGGFVINGVAEETTAVRR